MYFEDTPVFDPTFNARALGVNDFGPEPSHGVDPIGANAHSQSGLGVTPSATTDPGPGNDLPVGSLQFAETGLIVVGAEYASSSTQLMWLTDGGHNLLGFAFDNGDGDWGPERQLLEQGLTCAGGIATMTGTEGLASYVIAAGTAFECSQAVEHAGALFSEYQHQGAWTMSTTTWFDSAAHNGWDGVYTYTYPNQGSWSIYYDKETGTLSNWYWTPKNGS